MKDLKQVYVVQHGCTPIAVFITKDEMQQFVDGLYDSIKTAYTSYIVNVIHL